MWRVSTVLSLSGLSTPYTFSREAQQRGLAVHAYNHALAIGKPTGIPPDDPYTPQKAALDRWYADFNPTVVEVEHRIISLTKRLTGRIDLAIVYHDDPIIVDVKTGASAACHGIQVSGYVDLANADPVMHERVLQHSFGPWSRALLYLHANGKYDWRSPLQLLQRGPQDDYLWRSAHSLVCWKYDHQLLAVTDPEIPDDDHALRFDASTF